MGVSGRHAVSGRISGGGGRDKGDRETGREQGREGVIG